MGFFALSFLVMGLFPWTKYDDRPEASVKELAEEGITHEFIELAERFPERFNRHFPDGVTTTSSSTLSRNTPADVFPTTASRIGPRGPGTMVSEAIPPWTNEMCWSRLVINLDQPQDLHLESRPEAQDPGKYWHCTARTLRRDPWLQGCPRFLRKYGQRLKATA